MVNQADWPQAATVLREHPEWDAGVHLVMNDGQPVLPLREVGTLVDRRGVFRDELALLASAFRGKDRFDHVKVAH